MNFWIISKTSCFISKSCSAAIWPTFFNPFGICRSGDTYYDILVYHTYPYDILTTYSYKDIRYIQLLVSFDSRGSPRSEPSAGLCVERHTRRPASGPGEKLHGPT